MHFEFSAIFHQVGPLQDAFGPNASDQVAQVQSPRFPVPRSSSKTLFEATPRFLYHFSEDILCLFVSSLFENSAAPTAESYRASSSSSSKFSLARSVRPRPSFEFHLKFLRTNCLSSFQVCLRNLLQPHSRGLSDKFKFKFVFKFRRTFDLSSSQVCLRIPVVWSHRSRPTKLLFPRPTPFLHRRPSYCQVFHLRELA